MIAVIEEAKELFPDVEHPEGMVLRLDPMVDQNTGETQIGISAGEPQAGDQGIEQDGVGCGIIRAPAGESGRAWGVFRRVV